MDRQEEEFVQAIRLTKGVDEKEARENAKFIKRIEDKQKEISNWAVEESKKDETIEKTETSIEIMLISAILMRYNVMDRNTLIESIHQTTVINHEQNMKKAKTMKEMGELTPNKKNNSGENQ